MTPGRDRGRGSDPGLDVSRWGRLGAKGQPAGSVARCRLARILIVDDDPSIRFMLRLMLERAGHEVGEAQHGAAALAVLEGELPDLVLTDLMMPVIGGAELVRLLRAEPRTASLRIMVVSANPGAIGEGSRADAVLAKPFIQAELLEQVTSLLRLRETA